MISSDNQITCCTILKKKDREAFDFLYAEFNSQFYGMALQCLGDKDLADEMMILTFTKIWKDLEKFNGNNAQWKSWSISILMHSLRNNVVSAKPSETAIPQQNIKIVTV